MTTPQPATHQDGASLREGTAYAMVSWKDLREQTDPDGWNVPTLLSLWTLMLVAGAMVIL